ncbi:MAG TPA: hypothetical protein VN714_29515 [Trebonia sp.]|nr:hypothetical protein [Trebonia sp.]
MPVTVAEQDVPDGAVAAGRAGDVVGRHSPGERGAEAGVARRRVLPDPHGRGRGRDVAGHGVEHGDAPGDGRPGDPHQVEAAIRDLGWLPGAAPLETAWHWRRSGFEELFSVAASGRFPERKQRRGWRGSRCRWRGSGRVLG